MASAVMQFNAPYDDALWRLRVADDGTAFATYGRLASGDLEVTFSATDKHRLIDFLLDAVEAVAGERPIFRDEVTADEASEILRANAR